MTLSCSRVDAVSVHIVERIAKAAVDDMQARYDIGQSLLDLRQGHVAAHLTPYAIHSIATRLNIHPSAVRRYARVAGTIRADEFAALLSRRNAGGLPIKWSHIELIADVRRAPIRQRIADRVMIESLSVRALAAIVRGRMDHVFR